MNLSVVLGKLKRKGLYATLRFSRQQSEVVKISSVVASARRRSQ